MDEQWRGRARGAAVLAVLTAVLAGCQVPDDAEPVPAQTRAGTVVTEPVHVPGTMRAV